EEALASEQGRLFQQGLHNAIGGLALDPPCLPVMKGCLIRSEKCRCQLRRRALLESQASRCDEDARQEPGKVSSNRGEGGLVEIIEVEVGEPIVALVAAEVLQVEIAGDPGARSPVENGLGSPVLVKEVTGSAHESKRVLPHRLVLERETLGLAARVVALNALHYRQSRHRSCPFYRSRQLVSLKLCNELSPGVVLLGARSSRVAIVRPSVTAAVTTGFEIRG